MSANNTGKNFLLFLFLVPLFVHGAQGITWTRNTEFIDIGNRIERMEDTSCALTIEQVSDSTKKGLFKPSKNKVLNFGFAGNVTWLKISFKNNTSDILCLSLEQALLPVADFYFKNDSGQWQCFKAGYNVNINNKKVRNHYQVFPLQPGEKEYYIRLISFSPPVTVKIWNTDAFELSAATQKIAYGIYIGLLAFVIILNVFFYFTYGLRMYLYYSILVFFYLMVSAFVMDGYGVYFFHHVNYSFTYVLLPLLTSISIIPFAYDFLEVEKYAPRLYKFSRFILGWFILYAAVLVFIPQRYALMLNQMDAMIITLLMISMGISVGEHHNKIGSYFAAAYLFFFILVISQIVYMQTGFPPCPFGMSHVSVAIFIESMLLAYLLARRLKWEETSLQLAKDESQAQLLQKTQENETLMRDQNIKLEETVKERTLEIASQKEILEQTLVDKEELLNEREILLKEIHHRVKNNLQTISSILTMQCASLMDDKAKAAVLEIQSRVHSIALVHQKLYQNNNLDKVELKGFIEGLCQQIKILFGERSKCVSVSVNLPEMFIETDVAVPLGLILNELITNSLKYAFPEGCAGEICIWVDTTADSLKLNKLVYSDTGKGLPSSEYLNSSQTLGLRMVKILSRQIGADIGYSNIDCSQFTFVFSTIR